MQCGHGLTVLLNIYLMEHELRSIAEMDSQVARDYANQQLQYKSTILGRSLKKEHVAKLMNLGFEFPQHYYSLEQKKYFFLNWLNENPKYKRNSIEEILTILKYSKTYGNVFENDSFKAIE